ncbi:MAG: hypothetical protein LAT65_18545 [Saccharospirillum sp.]|nr:hypothetical protein [Saccharospirillum sp.]
MGKAAVWLTAVGLSWFSTQAIAQSFADAVAQCRQISNQAARYACYDNIETGPSNQRRDVGKFNYQSTFDPITGQAQFKLSIRSDRGLNPRGNPIILEWSCDSTQPGDYRLELIWQSFLESANPEVLTRIGDADPVVGRWQAGRLRETSLFQDVVTGFGKSEFVDALLAQIDSGNTSLVFRTQPYNRAPITAVFDFSGFDELVLPMRESCQF